MAEITNIYSNEERNRKIKKELTRLKKSMPELAPNQQVILKNLFQEAAFLSVILEESRMMVQRDGMIEQYQNGATQKGVKKSAAMEVYDKSLNSYMKIIDQINKAMPEGKTVNPAEALLQFACRTKR